MLMAATRAGTLVADSGLVPFVNDHLHLMRFGGTPDGARIMPKARRKPNYVGNHEIRVSQTRVIWLPPKPTGMQIRCLTASCPT